MSKQQMDVYVFMEEGYTEDYSRKEWRPHAWGIQVGDAHDRIFSHKIQVEVDVPDNFNPIPHQVAALEAEKEKALEEYQAKAAQINERLSKLLALTNEVVA
jgi:hypothetical protein